MIRLWPLSPPAPLFLPAVGSAAGGSFVFGPSLRIGRDGKVVGRDREAGPPSAKREGHPRQKINPLHRSVEVRPSEADSMRASTSHAAAVEPPHTSGETGLTRDRPDPGCGAGSRGKSPPFPTPPARPTAGQRARSLGESVSAVALGDRTVRSRLPAARPPATPPTYVSRNFARTIPHLREDAASANEARR